MITRNPRAHLTASVALLVLSLSVAACSTDATGKTADSTANTPKNATLSEDQLQRIHIVTIQPTSFRPLVEATGNVAFNGDKSTQVLSPVSGPATRVVANVGMKVTRGQPLAYVSSPDFASAVADYRKAQNAYRQAKRVADRDSALFKNDALARAELEQAQSDVAAAEADVESAVQSMHALGVEDSQIQAVKDGKTASIEAIIRSPIDGTDRREAHRRWPAPASRYDTDVHHRRPEHDVDHGERVRERSQGRHGRRNGRYHHGCQPHATARPCGLHRRAGRSGHEGGFGPRRCAERESRSPPRHVCPRPDQVG